MGSAVLAEGRGRGGDGGGHPGGSDVLRTMEKVSVYHLFLEGG